MVAEAACNGDRGVVLSFLRKIKFAKAFFTLVADPMKTDAVFDLADGGPSAALEHGLSMCKKSAAFRNLLESRYIPPTVHFDELLKLPANTFGHAYAKHMTKNNLDPNFYRKPKGDSDTDYLKFRGRQTHDYWHIATGYSTEEWDEFALQSFMIGQFQSGLSMVILAASFLRMVQISPQRIGEFVDHILTGYQKGKSAEQFMGVKWEEEFATPLVDLQKRLRVNS